MRHYYNVILWWWLSVFRIFGSHSLTNIVLHIVLSFEHFNFNGVWVIYVYVNFAKFQLRYNISKNGHFCPQLTSPSLLKIPHMTNSILGVFMFIQSILYTHTHEYIYIYTCGVYNSSFAVVELFHTSELVH